MNNETRVSVAHGAIAREVHNQIFSTIKGKYSKLDEFSIVDLGCAEGGLATATQLRWPGSNVTAIDRDISQFGSKDNRRMRWIGRRLPPLRNIITKEANLEQELPFSDFNFDVVTLNRVSQLLKPTKQRHLLLESKRILKPEGLLIITQFSPDLYKVKRLTKWKQLLIKRKAFKEVGLSLVSSVSICTSKSDQIKFLHKEDVGYCGEICFVEQLVFKKT